MKTNNSLEKSKLFREKFLNLFLNLSKKLDSFHKNNLFLSNLFVAILVTIIVGVIFKDAGIILANHILAKIQTSYYWKLFFIIIISCLSFAILLSIVYITQALGNKKLKRIIEQKNKEMSQFGVTNILTNEDDETIRKNYKQIADTIKKYDNTNTIDFILTTGYEPISMHDLHDPTEFQEQYKGSYSNKAQFHDILKNVKTKSRVLLLHPESIFANERGRDIIRDEKLYSDLIYRTIACLEKIKKINPHVEYGFYNQNPVWKIIKTDNLVFIQAVHSRGLARKETWIGLLRSDLSITDGFDTLFKKKWEERNTFNLNNDEYKKRLKFFKKQLEGKMQ